MKNMRALQPPTGPLLGAHLSNKAQTGICFDTSHVFAAGYDIRTKGAYRQTMAAFDAVVGLGRLQLIHLNDSKYGLGSRVDRHEHIGRGEIGKKAFGFIMNDAALMHIPKIIETPKKEPGEDWDALNLQCLQELVRHRPKRTRCKGRKSEDRREKVKTDVRKAYGLDAEGE